MFQVVIGRVMGTASTGEVKFDTGEGIAPVNELTVRIEGCPFNGIEAVDFRRNAGLPEAPNGKLALPPFVWTDESFLRPLLTSDYREMNCDLWLEYKSPYLWGCNAMGEVYQSRNSEVVLVEPAAILSYLQAHATVDNVAIAEAGRLLVMNALAAEARSKARAEAEREQMRPEIEARQQAEAAAKAEREREAAKAKAIKDAGEKTLRLWIGTGGSALLKARIEDGFEWVGLAEREYANAVVSDLGGEIEFPEYEEQKESKRTTPTIEEITRLRDIHAAIEGKPATAELIWSEYEVKIEDEYGATNQTEKTKRAEVKVTVTCPTGRTLDYYYGIDAPANCGCTDTVRCDLHKNI